MAHTLIFFEHNDSEAIFGCTDCNRIVALIIADGSTVMLAPGLLVDHGVQDLAEIWAGMNTGARNRRGTSGELKQLENNPLWVARRRP